MLSMRSIRIKRQARGFVLAAVLWLLAGLSLVVALMGDSAVSVAARVSLLRERTEFVRQALTVRANFQYWAARSRAMALTYSDGVNQVLVNDVPYRLLDGSSVRLQDHAGLLALNAINRVYLIRWLAFCGVSGDRADALVDALEDYVDEDHLSRIQGAERDAYALAGLPPPRNAPLLSAQELWRVMGWSQVREQLVERGCARELSVYVRNGLLGSPAVNPSSAPPRMQRVIGMDDSLVEQLQALRTQPEEFSRLSLSSAEGLGLQNMFGISSAGQASRFLRVQHQSATGRLRWEYTIEMLPEQSSQAWVILQPSFHVGDSPVLKSVTDGTLTWPLFDLKAVPVDANPVLSF
jgi:general secretion pathway protein K